LGKKPALTGQQQVAQFLENTDHPLKDEIIALREIILEAGEPITEHIKWNAPSFCFEGEDRFTFNLHSRNVVNIVFHRGAKVKAMPKERLVEDPEKLLNWSTNDRGIISFTNMAEIQMKKKPFMELINNWLVAASERRDE
jgi:hypothetical protein